MTETIPSSQSGVVGALRVLAGLAALIPTALGLFVARNLFETEFNPIGGLFCAVMATAAFFGWWFVCRGHVEQSRKRMGLALIGGVSAGLIGVLGGTLVPMVLKPDANQGPLLGIFLIGPSGFILGSILGWVYARFGRGGLPAGQS